MKPLAIDLFCGLGGWTDGLLAQGYDVVGFDITQHVYGNHRYPAQLVVQDVTTDPGKGARFTSRDCGLESEGVKQRGSGREWFAGEGKISRLTSSASPARKMASAMIAKIPMPLSSHIAATFYPAPPLQLGEMAGEGR